MRLRSRTIDDRPSLAQFNDNGQCPSTTPRPRRAGKRNIEKDDETLEQEYHSPSSYEDTATRLPPVVQGRGRKRPAVFADREDLVFKTPVRVQHHRVSSEIDHPSPQNSAVRNIYTPIVRFLTPTKENSRSPRSGDVLMSPEQCVFGFGSIGLLEGEEDNEDAFSPFAFIKNIPSRSQQSKPCVRDIPPKTRSTPQATLVLDLDETLMYSSLSVIDEADYTFRTAFQDHEYKVYVILRPYVKDFLQAMSKVFEMFVYTSAKKEYAEKILDILDPRRKLFRHRLYQVDCTCVLGHYVKDLGVLQRDLAKTVVLDNAPHTYPYHLMNMIPIKSWSGDKEDKELQKLIPYLERLSGADDFRAVLKRRTDHFHRLLSED
ncbi:CTD small phosphatase-like protein 3 [Hypomesus transpacificus]|uniref:CTD small phosphatase-like protein 3 n=1 Tax=Hypomesus transpacificus TaxID=137520 RepID=UPI001F07EB3F|nr:CTD small phosphatase-like protein 3 [Hypomesus transpacificus]XP_046906240.1 CTD small phosphatase-like protein 3 [Hypomesus transpacificus]